MEKHRRSNQHRRFKSFLFSPLWTRAVAGFAAIVIFSTTYWLMLPASALTKNAAADVSGLSLEQSGEILVESEETPEDPTQNEQEEPAAVTSAENADSGAKPGAGNDGSALDGSVADSSSGWEPIPEAEQPVITEETTPVAGESAASDGAIADSAAAPSESQTKFTEDANAGKNTEAEVTETSGGTSADTGAGADAAAESGAEDGVNKEGTVSETESPETEEETTETEELSSEESEEEDEEEEEVFGSGKLLFRGNNYSVTIEYGEDAKIPEAAELRVRELEADSDEYQAHYETAKSNAEENGAEVRTARFFDITIVAPEKDSDSEDAAEESWREIEPAAPVKVNIAFDKEELELPENAEVEVLHFADENNAEAVEKEKVEVETSENSEGTAVSGVGFDADAFSVFGVVGTEIISTSFTTGDGSTYEVTVTYDKDTGLPENAKLVVSEVTKSDAKYDDYVKQAADAIKSRARDLDYIKLLDIQIVDENGNKAALDHTVSVQIKLLDREQAGETTQIVHFEGAKETPVLMKSSVEDDTVEFSTDGFSVYAVVDEGEGGDEARVTVNFYGKDTTEPIATVYVKNSDTLDDLEDIVFDPGCGELDASKKELFDGWVISTVDTTDGSHYTIDTEGKTIEDVRKHLEQLEIKEGNVVNVYAKIVRTITISYEGESDNTSIGSAVLKVIGSDNPASTDNIAEYTINMAYTPATSTQAFMGWNVAEGSSNILTATYEGESATPPYQNGTKITVKGDVKLSVNAPFGHWLVFDENGHGATYNAPQFVKNEEETKAPPLDMERLGYSFDGWYKLKENVDISAVPKDEEGYYIISDEFFDTFTFGEELEDNLTVYAKWTSAATANYTVIVWKERMTDTYAENGGIGEGKSKNYDFAESYTFKGPVGQYATAVSNGSTYVVDGDDDATEYYNARIQGTDVNTGTNVNTTVSYTGYHCAGYDEGVTVAPEGTSVVNVYYDRNTVTYTFYTYGESTTAGEWKLCREDGTVHTGDIAVLKPGGDPNEPNDYERFTGTPRYGDGRTYYYSTSGTCNGDTSVIRELHWEFKSNSGRQWNVYQKSIGLYGEALNWPDDTSIWWYEEHNATTGTGTRMTYKDAFLPNDSDMTVEYWGTKSSASGMIHFWTQDVNGTTYTDQVQINTGNANFKINNKFTGFYAVRYRVDNNGPWRDVGSFNPNTGIYGDPVSYNTRLDIRYNRITAPITFLDGAFYDGSGKPIENETPQADPFKTTQEYFYGGDVSSYNKGGTDYYTPPEKPGYTFAGWYADDACTVEYDFGTMPATGITVYAKWIQNQYRVFLHPNVPETDTSLNWGSETQAMNFRVSSGSKVSAPTGTRTEYKFIGWYLDENCTEVFDSSRFVLNDTTVTTPYDKTVDMTDVMNKYGNIEGTGTNADATGYNGGDRFWITKKLDLYAKWRAELVGAEGIGVKYDPNGGSNAPTDTTQYLDNTSIVAQGAPTPPDENLQFLHWVMQRYDETQRKFVDLEGDEYIIYPGASFTVLKNNALVEELEGSTEADPKYRYTVQLRAEYGPKETPTPTHLTWYANGGISADGTVDRYTDPSLQINEAVIIKPANTFKRDGYSFLGWARVDSTEEGYEISPKNLTEGDLFLKFEDGKYYAKDSENEWTEVEKVAADERMPYHDIYAVWEEKTYSVSVTKLVTGLDGDDEVPFSFNLSMNGATTPFRLVGKENGADIPTPDGSIHIKHTEEYKDIPYGTEISVQELLDDKFNVSELYSITGADNSADNVNNKHVENGAKITVKGNVQITFNNTRKTKLIRIMKTTEDGRTPLGEAIFETTVDDTTYTFTSDSVDGFLKNGTYTTGTIMAPYGTYVFSETKAPDGYLPLKDAVTITVGDQVRAAPYTVKEPEGDVNYYTIIIPNNSGVALPSTGGAGTTACYIWGLLLTLMATVMLLIKKKIIV